MHLALKLALLIYLAGATWSLTTRFVAWGDNVSALVGDVARSMTFDDARAEADRLGGIDFVECMCPPSSSERGAQLVLLGLYLGGTPLALATARRRRRGLSGEALLSSAGAQAGFLLQLIALPITILFVPVTALVIGVEGASPGAVGFALVGLLNIVFGVPAVGEWRRLQAAAFGAPRRVLRLA